MTYYQDLTSKQVYEFNRQPSGDNWQKISAPNGKELQQLQARESLKNIFSQSEDKRVYCVLRHVSASGMSRRIDFYVIRDNEPQYLTGLIGMALDYKRHDRGGLVIGGCGMDMGFHVIYTLSSVLYGRKHDADSGYILKSEWI